MKIESFEFDLRELAGSMGDFGTLFLLAVGYIVVCGLNPAGFLVDEAIREMDLAALPRDSLKVSTRWLLSESLLVIGKCELHSLSPPLLGSG